MLFFKIILFYTATFTAAQSDCPEFRFNKLRCYDPSIGIEKYYEIARQDMYKNLSSETYTVYSEAYGATSTFIVPSEKTKSDIKVKYSCDQKKKIITQQSVEGLQTTLILTVNNIGFTTRGQTIITDIDCDEHKCVSTYEVMEQRTVCIESD